MAPMQRLGRTHMARVVTAGVALLIAAGCATAPPRDAVPSFRQGVITADQQTSSAFTDINSFLRRQQIDRAMRQPALSETMFLEALAAEDIAKWDRAFGLIDSYAEKLEQLLNPGVRSGVEDELSTLGAKIESLRQDQLPSGLSAGFTKLGGLLVKLKTDRDALDAIRTADPAIQDIFRSMMEAIGENAASGVRGTVRTAWSQVLAEINVREFMPARSEAAKREAVLHYIKVLEERDAQDRLLDSLRLSLSALAKAHQEIAQGRNRSAAALLQLVQDEYKGYKEQLKLLRERREEASTVGGKG